MTTDATDREILALLREDGTGLHRPPGPAAGTLAHHGAQPHRAAVGAPRHHRLYGPDGRRSGARADPGARADHGDSQAAGPRRGGATQAPRGAQALRGQRPARLASRSWSPTRWRKWTGFSIRSVPWTGSIARCPSSCCRRASTAERRLVGLDAFVLERRQTGHIDAAERTLERVDVVGRAPRP